MGSTEDDQSKKTKQCTVINEIGTTCDFAGSVHRYFLQTQMVLLTEYHLSKWPYQAKHLQTVLRKPFGLLICSLKTLLV